MIKYVLFDMDGTLLDTEPLYEQSWIEAGRRYGVEVGDMYATLVCGRPVESAKYALWDRFGKDFDAESVVSYRMARYRELAQKDLKLKAGCVEILEFLREQDIPCALATSTLTDLALANLKRTGIADYFDAVVTSAMVERGKPYPDIFLEAGKRIGADAESCIVCEDSYSGIAAAHAAGMKPVFIPDRQPPNGDTEDMAYKTLENLFEVIELIKKENKII